MTGCTGAVRRRVMVKSDEIAFMIERARQMRQQAERARALAARARQRAAQAAQQNTAVWERLFPLLQSHRTQLARVKLT